MKQCSLRFAATTQRTTDFFFNTWNPGPCAATGQNDKAAFLWPEQKIRTLIGGHWCRKDQILAVRFPVIRAIRMQHLIDRDRFPRWASPAVVHVECQPHAERCLISQEAFTVASHRLDEPGVSRDDFLLAERPGKNQLGFGVLKVGSHPCVDALSSRISRAREEQ